MSSLCERYDQVMHRALVRPHRSLSDTQLWLRPPLPLQRLQRQAPVLQQVALRFSSSSLSVATAATPPFSVMSSPSHLGSAVLQARWLPPV